MSTTGNKLAAIGQFGEAVRRGVGLALSARAPGGDKGVRRELAEGIDAAGEAYAIPHLAAIAVGLRPAQRIGLVRAVAIAAEFGDCPHKPNTRAAPYRFGHAMQVLRRRTGSDSIERRIQLLPECDLDHAVDTIRSLIAMADAEHLPVNFIDLASLLAGWGSGLTDAEKRRRDRVLWDFYGADAAIEHENNDNKTAIDEE